MSDPKTWTGGRTPLTDPEQESARTAAYWEWLAQAQLVNYAPTVAFAARLSRWVMLANEEDADYEARYLQHSIGHSWNKYSKYGSIYSLRDARRLPQVTILVSDNVIVHAREHENARLSLQNQSALETLASKIGWSIKPDQFSFDVLRTPDAPNTRLTYVTRDAANTKTFGFLVLAGHLEDSHIEKLEKAVEVLSSSGNTSGFISVSDTENSSFNKWLHSQKGLTLSENSIYELQSVRDTAEIPTSSLQASQLASRISAAIPIRRCGRAPCRSS